MTEKDKYAIGTLPIVSFPSYRMLRFQKKSRVLMSLKDIRVKLTFMINSNGRVSKFIQL